MEFSKLTSHNSTKELIDWLSEQKLNNNQSQLDEARVVLGQWADEYANGKGTDDKIVIMDPDQESTTAEIFGYMDRPQAERFLEELFNDIVPHLADQRQAVKDVEQGRMLEDSQANPVTDLMSELAKHLPEGFGDLFASIQTKVQALTWVDDRKKTITTKLSLGIEVDEDASKGRGIKP